MKNNTKSSITLPPDELKLVIGLMKKTGSRSKVEVIRRGLKLLKDSVDRQALKDAYREASLAARGTIERELEELDGVSDDGIDA